MQDVYLRFLQRKEWDEEVDGRGESERVVVAFAAVLPPVVVHQLLQHALSVLHADLRALVRMQDLQCC